MERAKTYKKSVLRGKRVTAFLLVCLMAFLLAGCGNPGKDLSGGAENASLLQNSTSESADDSAEGESVTMDASADGTADTGSMDAGAAAPAEDSLAGGESGDGGVLESEGAYSADDMAMEDAVINTMGSSKKKAEAGEDIAIGSEADEDVTVDSYEEETYQPRAGTLTAGAWDDNENWGFYKNLFAPSSDYNSYKTVWGMNYENRIRVKVTDGGKAVKQAKVSLLDEDGLLIWESVSRYDGYADLFYVTDKDNTKKPAGIKVEKDGIVKETVLAEKEIGSRPIIEEEDIGQGGRGSEGGRGELPSVDYGFEPEYEIELTGTKEGKKKLDLMFVVDTTGSMSDEIAFLQTELKDVISNVKNNNSGLPVRISMNFYKDEGDDYVVDSHEFTDSVEEAQRLINNEYASGGGDNPEAVDQAVSDGIISHSWDEDSTKIMFLLLDAPPHYGQDINKSLSESLKEASRKGIRIIPVAASGIDKETEFLLRAMSVSTDGTYVFLTDDSGIGNSHLEPTIGDYDVELLNELMVRLINQYLG